MAKKREKLFSKVFMLIFLVLIVLGFTIPGFMNQDENTSPGPELRICQTDADCYLMCDYPVAVLCSQNLCWQNACEEQSYYLYSEKSTTFQLNVKIDDEPLNLENRTVPGNFFVTFSENQVHVFALRLSLQQVLEKINLLLTDKCLFVGTESYCNDVQFFINGEQAYTYGNYVPQEGDQIKIIY